MTPGGGHTRQNLLREAPPKIWCRSLFQVAHAATAVERDLHRYVTVRGRVGRFDVPCVSHRTRLSIRSMRSGARGRSCKENVLVSAHSGSRAGHLGTARSHTLPSAAL